MAMNDFGQSKVTVKKTELLEKVKYNRSKHREDFIEARKAYRLAVTEALEKAFTKAKAGEEFKTYFGDLDEPHEHTEDYDTVVGMLEMSTADEITITENQFRQFVLDKWGWKEAFTTNVTKYISR